MLDEAGYGSATQEYSSMYMYVFGSPLALKGDVEWNWGLENLTTQKALQLRSWMLY